MEKKAKDSDIFCQNCGEKIKADYVIDETYHYAGFANRLAAYLIDGIIIYIVSFIIGLVLSLLELMQLSNFSGIVESGMFGIGSNIFSIITTWLYFAIMESSSKQATLGKMALGIKVTDLEGNRISFGRATGRYFAKILSCMTLFIGYFMALFTEKKQALHDILAGTLVIKES